MKILAFTDIHSDPKLIKNVLKKSEKVDFLVCCGDFTFFGEDYKKVIKQLSSCKKPVFIIHGNHEEGNDLSELEKHKNIYFIHKKFYKINDALYIFGYGGGGFSYTDNELEKMIPKIRDKIGKNSKLILVTHQPPYKTELDIVASGHVGSMTIRKLISEVKPIIALSGHLHECFGMHDKIGNTLLINPSDEGRIIELK
ncbi:MAG TPA: metallophosphoesterase [Candidatus Nanoarchaeia archaeon]|nr:metallophosphoesterase [Candidatus Nanoarchaeia archaeon]